MTLSETEKAVQKKWRDTNKEKVSSNKKVYYIANKEKILAREKAWRDKNKQEIAIKLKAKRDANPGDNSARVKAWKASNPLMAYFQSKAGHCRRRGGDVTPPQLVALFKEQAGLCALTGRKMLVRSNSFHPDCVSVDRIEHGQPYTISNLRLTTWQANAARGAWTDDQLLAFCKDVINQLKRRTPP